MISKTIANYKILKELGAGGMGTVYLAENLSIGTKVAIKMLHPHLAKNENIKTRFLKEARTQAILDHPNIIKVIDLVENDQDFFIVMEFVEGEPLNDFLFNNKRLLPEDDVDYYMTKILDAVDYAHSKVVAHHDLKSANIMVTSNKDIKIIGFGIAELADEATSATKIGLRMGSLLYMSPEQVTNDHLDFRSDIYSLGVIYHEMLTGTPVYNQKTNSEFEIFNKIVKEPLPRLKDFSEINSDKAQEIVDTATAKIPATRFQNCGEFKSSLLKRNEPAPFSKIPASESKSPESTPAIPTKPQINPIVPKSLVSHKKQKKRTNHVLIVVILLVAALLGGGGYYFANEYNAKTESESAALLQRAENYYNTGEYREAFKEYNTVLSNYPGNNVAKQRVEGLMAQSDIFQKKSVDSVMQLYFQTASLEDFNPKDSILGYKITTGFNHVFNQLDTLKSSQKLINEPIVLNKALNDLEISYHYFTADALYAAGEVIEALEILKIASQIGQNSHVEQLKDLIANSIAVSGITEEKVERVSRSGEVSFKNAHIPPIFNGCPYNMNASELRECFNGKLKDYLDSKINPKNYNHLPLKSGIQNSKFSFVVGKDGDIKDIQVVAPHQKIEDDINYALQNLRGVKPGFQNHVPVEVVYNNNYSFEVINNKKSSQEQFKEEVVTATIKNPTSKKSISMVMADRAPVFPGCEDKNQKMLINCSTENINHFITEYIDYRSLSKAGVPKGSQSFFVKFQIDEQGGIQNVEVSSPLEAMKDEVIKVIKLMPQMEPGIYKSQSAIVDYSAKLTIETE